MASSLSWTVFLTFSSWESWDLPSSPTVFTRVSAVPWSCAVSVWRICSNLLSLPCCKPWNLSSIVVLILSTWAVRVLLNSLIFVTSVLAVVPWLALISFLISRSDLDTSSRRNRNSSCPTCSTESFFINANRFSTIARSTRLSTDRPTTTHITIWIISLSLIYLANEKVYIGTVCRNTKTNASLACNASNLLDSKALNELGYWRWHKNNKTIFL